MGVGNLWMEGLMSFQNRVDPWGCLHAVSERGSLLGNRGILHNERREIIRQWKGRSWVTCRTSFGDRHREVFSVNPLSYSELFFLDEATAFSAGHRPCAECRRYRYREFIGAWAIANRERMGSSKTSASEVDRILHSERVDSGGRKVAWEARMDQLPNGTMVALDGRAYLVWARALWPWTFSGYGPKGELTSSGCVQVLTPASVVRAFAIGFEPGVHITVDSDTTTAGVSADRSALPHWLVEAYRATDYRVGGVASGFVLHIDEPSEPLRSMFKSRVVTSAAYVSAFNPHGESTAESVNLAAHQRLLARVRAMGLEAIEGEGAAPSGPWPPERSFLVLGITLSDALRLGFEFGQNAVVWAGDAGVPRLILAK